MWAQRGSRPTAIKQTEYQWVYLWAAVEPASGEIAAMITPDVNTNRMGQFLAGLSSLQQPDHPGIVVLDNAGWHRAKALAIPIHLVLLPLPPHSPEPNPVERLWQWLRSHHLANRIYPDYSKLLHAPNTAMASLDAQRLRTVCACALSLSAVDAAFGFRLCLKTNSAKSSATFISENTSKLY